MVNLTKNTLVRSCVTILLISGLLFLSPGCAAIFCGSEDAVSIGPVSRDTTVLLDGEELAVPPDEPLEIELSRSTHHVVRLERKGYHPVEMTVRRVQNPVTQVDAAFMIPFLVPGLVAIAIDNSVGASWNLMPETVEVEMKKCEPGRHPHTILAN